MRYKIVSLLFVLSLFFICKESVFAVTDIELVENNDNIVDLVVTSGANEYLPAIDLKIHYSSNLEIDEDDITIAGDMCQLHEEVLVANNTISIECFNADGTKADGILASINFEGSGDYYFYVDTESLDIGGLEYTVTDINKPEDVVSSTTTQEDSVSTETENNNDSLWDKVKSFLIKYPFYTLLIVAGVIGLAAVVIANISAWAVTSLRVSVWLWARAMILLLHTTTAPMGISSASRAFSASM